MRKLLAVVLICLYPGVLMAAEISGYISTDPTRVRQKVAAEDNRPVQDNAAGGSGRLFSRSEKIPIVQPDSPLAPVVKGVDRKYFPDGTLVRSESGRIYVIAGDYKRTIRTLVALQAYRGQAIRDEADADLAQYPDRPYLNGELVRGQGRAEVYVIDNWRLRHIRTLAELRQFFVGREIHNALATELTLYM